MNITDKAISKPLTVFILIAAAAIYGIYSYLNIPLEMQPDISIPWVSVFVPYPGASPEEVENLIVRPLENESRGIDNLKNFFSYSSNSGAQVWYEFEVGSDNKEAVRDLEEIVNRVKHEFPSDANDPIIQEISFHDRPILSISLTSGDGREISYEQLKNIAEDMVAPFEGISGVSKVEVFGGRDKEFRVLLKAEKLEKYGLSIPQVLNSISSSNMDLPAGAITINDRDYTLRILGEYNNVHDIERTVVTVTQNGPIFLEDIATVIDTLEETSSYSRYDGNASVNIRIYKKTGINVVSTCGKIREMLDELTERIPDAISAEVTFDQSDYITENLNNLKTTAMLGGALVIIILIIGIGWRNAPLVAGAIPFIILLTFGALFFTGNTLNNISLFSLILMIGIVVDGAVIIVESTYRYLEYGYSKLEAAKRGVHEVGTAVLASAMTTMGAFVPMFMIGGITGQFMRLIPITVMFALIASVLTDHLVIPVVASKLVSLPKNAKKMQSRWFKSFFMKGYRKTLDWALRHRAATIIITILMFIGSFFLFPFVGVELWPEGDFREFTVSIDYPSGTPVEIVNDGTKKIEELVSQLPDIERYTSSIRGDNSSLDIVILESSNYNTSDIREMLLTKIDSIKPDITDARIEMASESMGPPSGAPIQVEIRGEELEILMDLAFQIKNYLRSIEGTRNIKDDFGSGSPEVRVIIKREQAAYYGITPADIVRSVAVAYNGTDITEVHIGDEEVDVRVELDDENKTLEVLYNFPIATMAGMTVPLEEVADIDLGSGFSRITRKNGMRLVTVSSDLHGVLASEVFFDLETFIDSIQTPGYTIEITGEREQMDEDFGNMGVALLVGVLLIYLIMAIQFQSLTHPLVIMFTLPFALIGVLVGLFITRNHFGILPLIGMLTLIGIVVNDAIVLITYVNNLRKQGYSIYQALRRAGPIRMRPIIMTSVTTIGGMLPLALGIGMKIKFWGPMIWPIIFGLFFSTVLTLIVIPVFYAVINRAGKMPKDLEELNLEEHE